MIVNEKMEAKHTAPIVTVFEQKFEENFEKLAKGERTSALWVQYYMVDVIKAYRPLWAHVLYCYQDAGHLFSCR